MNDLVRKICQQQSPGGGFISTVHLPFGKEEESNCFVTALVLRELSSLKRLKNWKMPEILKDACRRASGYLIRSRYPVYPNLYSFYPHRSHPFWMTNALYADADDTCIIALELVRYGYKPADTLSFIADKYLQKYRAAGNFSGHLTECWHRDGVFLTWFTAADFPNPIDCCVNANVLALLASAGLKKQPGYIEATNMINDAVGWAGDNPLRLREITPYYPHPVEFYWAVEHAVNSGVDELLPALESLSAIPWIFDKPNDNSSTRLCASLDDNFWWSAEVVHFARELKEMLVGEQLILCHQE